MGTLKFLVTIITFTFVLQGISQTPDQQKKMEEMQRDAEEAQKKAMEMMENNPQFQEAMKMMEGAEEEYKQEEMRRQVEAEKKQKDAAKDHLKDFYWRNKVASNRQGVFENWQWGTAEIAYWDGEGGYNPGRVPYEEYVIVGKVTESGT
ncbi:MAG: hypothetical protein WBN59_09905, partial [Flavobacteriaceae bacterium]